MLREDQTGYFFDEYCTKTVKISTVIRGFVFLAVNAERSFWVKSLIRADFLYAGGKINGNGE